MYFRLASLLLLGSILTACGSTQDTPTEPTAPVVRATVVRSASDSAQIQVIGTAVWRQETPLGFTSDGQIARVLVNEGDTVRRGQLLATLDTTPIAAELAAVAAEARRAGSEVARTDQLYRRGWVTKQRLEAAQASAQASSAQAQARRFALRTAQIVAPSSGTVLARLAEPTQVVAKGTPVLVIGEADTGYVMRAPVNDRVAALLRTGMPATVLIEALGTTPLQGRVVEIGGRARQTTGTFDVEIALPNVPGLRSGMIGTATLAAAETAPSQRIILPANAILSPRAGEALIYVVDAQSKARLRQVAVGETSDNGIEVLSGVRAGEKVILSGFEKIRDGAPVTPRTLAP